MLGSIVSRSHLRKLLPLMVTLAMAVSLSAVTACSSNSSQGGSQQDAASVEVTCQVIGIDGSGATQVWAPEATYEVAEGATAADLTEMVLADSSLQFNATNNGSWFLETITSPDGAQTLGYDESTGQFWQLFYNGASSDVGAGEITLQAGDGVVWYYSVWGEALPDAMPAAA